MLTTLPFAIFYSTLQAIAAFGVTILLARQIDPLIFGVYILSLSWALMLVQITDAALEQCFTSYKYSFGLDIYELYSNSIFLKLFLCCCCFGFLLIGDLFFSVQVPVTTLIFMVPLFYPVVIFEIREKLVLFAKILLAEKLFFFAVLLVYLQFFEMSNGIYAMYFTSSVVSLLFQYWILKLPLPQIQHFRVSLILHYVMRYWPVYVGMFSLMVIGIGSRIIMEHKLGIAVFASVSIVFTLTNSINIVNSQIEKYIRPIISKAASDSDNNAIKLFLSDYFKYYILPLVVGCYLVGLLSDWIVNVIFGPSWVQSGSYLKILIYMVVWTSIIRIADLVLVAVGKVKFGLVLSTIVATALTGFLLMLTDRTDVSTYLIAIMSSAAINACILVMYAVRKTWVQ